MKTGASLLFTHTHMHIHTQLCSPSSLPKLGTCCCTFINQPSEVPVNGADAGDAVVVTHSLGQESVPYLPGKHGGVLAFVIGDLVDHFGCSNLWFGSPDDPRADTARFIVPANDLGEKTCKGWSIGGAAAK